jgi:protein-disulfide isomerase
MRLVIFVVASNVMVSFAASEEISLGSKQAPVTIIEYGSLTCDNCLSFHKYVYPQFKKHYIDAGTVRFIFRHFPTGGSAVYGARAANCAGDKYYEMLDTLFSTVGKWVRAENKDAIFVKYATSLGVSSVAFTACISNKKHLDDILSQQKAARKDLDVIGTPTFFINGKMVRGKRSFVEMKDLINKALNKDSK